MHGGKTPRVEKLDGFPLSGGIPPLKNERRLGSNPQNGPGLTSRIGRNLYEEVTRLAETRLAQNTLNYLNIA